MKKIVIGASILLTLISAGLFRNYAVNENFISNYNNGIYQEKDVEGLFFLNIEICKAHYNMGNIYLKQEKFNLAIESYNKALEYNPSGELEISIRINLALAKLGALRQNTPQEWEDILVILRDAREGLYVNGVAHEFDDNGRSMIAEQLEEEIRRMEEQTEIEKLENEENDKQKESDEQEDAEAKAREEEIQEQQDRANEDREDELGGEGGGYGGNPW